MASPEVSISAYGLSHSTGGTFRGHAQGNILNIADANDVWEDINQYFDNQPQKAEKGKIYLHISDLSPPEIDITQPSFTAIIHNINKFQTIQQVIKHGSHDYSPICHELCIFASHHLSIKLHRSCLPSFYM